MKIDLLEVNDAVLAEYATIPIAFEVRDIFRVHSLSNGLGGLSFHIEAVEEPYCKNYDSEPGHHPTDWNSRFDTSRWGVLVAKVDGVPVGGAVVVWDTPDVDMLEGRQDLAVLWDLRIAPEHRGQGIGHKLFSHAAQWAQSRGAHWLKIETQNINAPACRFYARQGCELGSISRFAYPSRPDEVQLFWYKALVK